ncbi:MAG: hypothetical protein WA919_02425 [Coleofasciculaceae cyanobacterium]
MSIGDTEMIPILQNKLNEQGNKTMAVVYLNSGQPDLEQAAENWGKQRGYKVVKQPLNPHAQTITWGGW